MGSFCSCSSSSSAPAAPPIKITPWDGPGIKRTLDDNIAEVFCDKDVAGIELDQDTAWFDLKLFVMVLACIAGLVAQFYPIPFPDNRVLVLACVGIYFLISGVLQYITWFVDRDYIFQTRDGRKAAAAAAGGASSSGGMPPLHVRTAMAKYDDKYSVILESPRGVQQGATLSFSVGKVFCADGRYSAPHFAAVLRDHFATTIAELRGKKDN